MGCPLPPNFSRIFAHEAVQPSDIEGLMQKALDGAKKGRVGKKPELLVVVLPEGSGETWKERLV